MLQRELLKHQWKAFLRHPMFERNLGIKIFMYFMFAILGLQLFAAGFVLDKIFLEIGTYDLAIYTFNSFTLYLFLIDFTIKYIFKQNQSMQIAPYLTLPIKRNRLFNFLLTKEFTSVWNLYLLVLIIPFSLKSITPFFGFGTAILYILFFYSICIGNSLLVNIANNLLKKNGWFILLPVIVIATFFGLSYFSIIDWGRYTVQIGEWVLSGNPLVWLVQLLILAGLWKVTQKTMLSEIYRGMEGEKVKKAMTFASISFLDRFGEMGEFINLEIKMITRTRRLKSQLFTIIFFPAYYFSILYSQSDALSQKYSMLLFFGFFTVGSLGLILAQYMFAAESSFFDGLMARNRSLLNMMKGKYLLYSSYALLMTCVLMIPVYHGKLSFLYVISLFFYTIGFLFFFMFQNAVFNKSYIDLFDRGSFNWKGVSGNMMIISMLSMFIPITLVMIISFIFSQNIAYNFMLIVGMGFTFTSNYWIEWTYNRFLKRKYKNMEGFRSNA